MARIRRRPALFAAFVLALAVTVFFAARLVVISVVWSDPDRRNQPIEGWMTPGYVVHSWQVPREVIADVVGTPPERGLTLADLARMRGEDPAALIAALEAAIAAHRAAQP